MVFFRWIIGVPIAALVTAGLFMIMAGLIQQPLGPIQSPTNKDPIEIVMKPEPPDKSNRIKYEKIPEERPPVDIRRTLPGEKPTPTNSTPNPGKVDPEGINPIQMSGPIIRIAPTYPEGCRSKGIEGEVLVQFDVTAEGNVVNVRVIEAPDRCFNRIISTVSKWKYPPAYQDGRPIKRYGVVERFNFQLTG